MPNKNEVVPANGSSGIAAHEEVEPCACCRALATKYTHSRRPEPLTTNSHSVDNKTNRANQDQNQSWIGKPLSTRLKLQFEKIAKTTPSEPAAATCAGDQKHAHNSQEENQLEAEEKQAKSSSENNNNSLAEQNQANTRDRSERQRQQESGEFTSFRLSD